MSATHKFSYIYLIAITQCWCFLQLWKVAKTRHALSFSNENTICYVLYVIPQKRYLTLSVASVFRYPHPLLDDAVAYATAPPILSEPQKCQLKTCFLLTQTKHTQIPDPAQDVVNDDPEGTSFEEIQTNGRRLHDYGRPKYAYACEGSTRRIRATTMHENVI